MVSKFKINPLCLRSMKPQIRKVVYLVSKRRTHSNSNNCHLKINNNNSEHRENFLKSKSFRFKAMYVLITSLIFRYSIVDAQEFFPDMDLEVLKDLYI